VRARLDLILPTLQHKLRVYNTSISAITIGSSGRVTVDLLLIYVEYLGGVRDSV